MEKNINFEKRMAEKAIGTSAMGKALIGVGKMLSSFQGCSGEPMGGGASEIIFPAGEKVCYFFGSQKEPVIVQDDVTQEMVDSGGTVGIKRSDGRLNRVDVNYLKSLESCNKGYRFPDDEMEEEDD